MPEFSVDPLEPELELGPEIHFNLAAGHGWETCEHIEQVGLRTSMNACLMGR